MFAIDTETTGTHWQMGTIPFAIGIAGAVPYQAEAVPVDPFTRKAARPFSQSMIDAVREAVLGESGCIFQNSNFDIKAMCAANIFAWDEPSEPEFWAGILELGHLVHLHDSTDAGWKASLKKLTPAYLGKDYESQETLDRIIIRCRNFIRHRDVSKRWAVGSERTLPYLTTGHGKADMWLPAALRAEWEDQDELQEYMGEDYELLHDVVHEYLQDDCENTLELGKGFLTRLVKRHGSDELERLLSMNRDITSVVWKIETLGIPVDKAALEGAMETCQAMVNQCYEVCRNISGMDVKRFSDANLREILINRFQLESPHTTEKTGMPSCDQKARMHMLKHTDNKTAIEFLANLEAAKKYETKLKYFGAYDRNAVCATAVPYRVGVRGYALYPSLNSVGTATTRFSSSNPNSQNIESGKGYASSGCDRLDELMEASPTMRSVFRPEEGRWWFPIDYSQLQLRIFAAATQDPALIQSFDDGYDFHDFMAKAIFGDVEITKEQRRIAKNTNFGFIFGASSKKIDKTAGIKGLYKHLLEKFPGAKNFIAETKRSVERTGKVHTLQGYPIHLPLTTSPWGSVSYPAHLAVNYIVQGTEGQLVKRAMYLVDRYLAEEWPEARIIANIHDEVIIDTPERPPKEKLRKIAELMELAGTEAGLTAPVDVELCVHNLSSRQEVVL